MTNEMQKVQDMNDEINMIHNRMKVWEGIKDKKKNKLKDDYKDKEARIKQIERELKQGYKDLDIKTEENEKLSSEVKQLKNMVPTKTLNMSVVEEDKHYMSKDISSRDLAVGHNPSKQNHDDSDDLGSDREPRPESSESDKKHKNKRKSRRDGNKAEDDERRQNRRDIDTPTESIGL